MNRGAPPTTPRLEAWIDRTQTPLDLLALLTIWVNVLPFTSVSFVADYRGFWVAARLLLSFVYGVDMAVRCVLSRRPVRYAVRNPVGVLAVIVPAVRILFSLRLLTAMFRRGNLGQFLFVALVLVLNGSLMVFAFESNAPDGNIVTVGDAVWWAAVTVATVGYGDYYPVTVWGKVVAVGLMAVGIATVAVVTAQIASSFMDQASARRTSTATSVDPASSSGSDPAPSPREAAGPSGLDARLERIEQLLLARLPSEDRPVTGEADPPA